MLQKVSSKRFTRNLLACYSRANPWHLERGLTWYSTANGIAKGMAAKYGCTLEQACGVLAALSPGRQWELNIVDAEEFIKAYTSGLRGKWLPRVGSYGSRNLLKSTAIMKGKPPLDVLGGYKVRAFYACLLDPYNKEDVCVDRHAKSAIYGRKLTDREGIVKKGEFHHIAQHYKRCAKRVGILPHQFQAIVWVVWRQLNGNLDQQDLFV